MAVSSFHSLALAQHFGCRPERGGRFAAARLLRIAPYHFLLRKALTQHSSVRFPVAFGSALRSTSIAMVSDEDLAERVATALSKPGALHETKKMMGTLCYMVDGKM